MDYVTTSSAAISSFDVIPIQVTIDNTFVMQGIYGCGAHSDFGVLTLLATDGSPGLQIRRNGHWVGVPSLPGNIIVNLGDMLERWTSNRFTSTMHRVGPFLLEGWC